MSDSLIDRLVKEKTHRPAKDYVSSVKDWYRTEFNKDLPLANIGLSDFHRKKGWEHSRAFDVSLHPDSESGRRLISYLQSQGIPYIAQTGAVSKGGRTISTGPHIHVGPPSSSMSKRSLVDRLVEQKSSGGGDDWVPATVAESRRKLFGEPTAAKGKTDFSQVTGGASGEQRTKLDHPYNAQRILTEAAASPEAERRMKLREQIRNERQPGMFAGTPSIDALLHPVETVRRVVDPEGSLDDAVRERIDAERRQGSPEVTAIRKEYGAMPTVPTPMGQRIQARSIAQPLTRAGGNVLKLAGGAASLAGLTPNKFSEWANERGRIVEEAASLPPLDARGQEIVQGLPEKVTTAVADTGLSIAQIILLKRATGLPFGRLMGLEATLRTSDMPLDKRTQEVAKAAVLGKVLERHLSRKLSAAAFAGPTAVETGAAVGKGQMSLEDAILQTAVSGGTGFALGGGKKSLVDRLVAEKESGQKPVPENVQVKPSEQKTSAEVSTKNVTDFDTYRDRAVERLTQKLEQERSPFREQRRYYEERLADPELARYAVAEKSPEGDLYAVPLGGSRKYGSSAVLYTKPEADRLLSRIQKLPGFDNARLRPVGEKFSIIWGEGGKFKSSEDLGRAYGYSEKAIAEFTTKKQSSVDNDPLITVYRGGELIPGKPQDYTTTREKAEKYAWNGVVSEIRVPKSMLDRYRVSEFRHDDYYLITPPKGEQIIRSDAVEPTPAVRQQAASATEVPRVEPRIETVTEPPAAVSPPSTTSARKATMAADRAELDLPELPPAERKSWQTTLDNAKSRGLDREATNLADEVLRKPRILDDEQTAGIVLRAQQVKNEHAAAMEKVRSASGAELESATDRLKSLEHELDRLTTAAKTSGSEKGRALAAQKLTINQDYDLISVLTRAKAAKGSDLTPKERVEYTELQQKYEAVLKQLQGVERKVVTDALQKDINRIAKTQQRTETKELLDAEFAVLQTQFKQARLESRNVQASGLAGIDPEGKLTALILRMAQNRIKAGVTKAEQLVDDIYNAVKDSVEGLTPDDVRDVLKGLPSQRAARLEKQIGEMEAGTWRPTKRERREPTDEEFKLIRKRDDLKRHIEAKLRHDAMGGGERFLREIGNVIGLYRSAMTSIDASFGLRQGKIGLSRHPSLWADAWKKQWAGVSNEKYDRAVWRIENDPDFPLMDRFGLETPSVAMKHSFSLTAKNEDFPSEWTQKIPVLRQSEQMFNLMGDVLRTSWFKSDLKMLQKAGFDPNNPEHADVFRKSAEDINTYTGRTNLQHLVPGKAGKALHQATPVLNQLTFAIRFWASRLKVLTLPLDPRMYPQIPRTMKLYKSMPRAQRVEAWKTLFAFYGLVATQLKAAQLAGAEIDVDPDSPDFLKARFEGISDRHFDVSAGMANHLRFAARMAKRIYEAKSGKPRKGFGNAPGAVIESYLRSKESPPVSIFHDIFLSRQTKEGRGTDFRGDPVYPTGEPGTGVVGRLKSARLLPKPIVMNDAMEAYDEMGWTGVATTLPFTFLGESVSVYKDGKKKKKATK